MKIKTFLAQLLTVYACASGEIQQLSFRALTHEEDLLIRLYRWDMVQEVFPPGKKSKSKLRLNVHLARGRGAYTTPLNYLIDFGSRTNADHFTERVKLLLDHGASISLRDSDGRLPLMIAAIYNRASLAELLSKNPLNTLNRVDKQGKTALILAAEHGSAEFIEQLLKKWGRRINFGIRDKAGKTALIYAAQKGHTTAVKELLKGKPHINAGDRKGKNPLMYAAEAGNNEMVALLVESGADVNAKDNRKEPVLSYTKNPVVKAYLESKGAKAN